MHSAGLLVDTGMCMLRKEMLAVGPATCVEHQPQKSYYCCITSPPDVVPAGELGRMEHIPTGALAQDENSYL